MDLKLFVQNKPGHLKQPFLIGSGTPEEVFQYFVTIDECIIEVGNTFNVALDILIASFFAFDLSYPDLIGPFFNFFTEQVYDVKDQKGNVLKEFAASVLASE